MPFVWIIKVSVCIEMNMVAFLSLREWKLVGLEIKALILLHVFMCCDSLITYYPCTDSLMCQQLEECVMFSSKPTVYGSSNSEISCYYGTVPFTAFHCYINRWPSLVPCVKLDCNVGFYAKNLYDTGCFACPSGLECSGGMKQPTICSNGYHCVSGIKEICPSNYFCNAGIKTACPIGYISPAGSSDLSACVLFVTCPEKFYCPTFLTRFNCNPGYFCPANRSVPIDCPLNSFCPENSSSPLKCDPQAPLSPLRSTSSSDCYNAMEGRELSPVTIISNGIQQKPIFKQINGSRGITNRMYFVFTHAGKSVNSITFRRKVSNVEILAVGGGGAGGRAMNNVDFLGVGNSMEKKAAAGGGGGAGLLIYQDFFPNVSTTYKITVGAGGKGTITPITTYPIYGEDGESGTSTLLSNGNVIYINATGGGGGGQETGKNGGSGGGSYREYSATWDINEAGLRDSASTICMEAFNDRWVTIPYKNTKKQPSINKQYGCPGLAGYKAAGRLYSGSGGGSSSSGKQCISTGGAGLSVDITGTLQPYAAGGGGFGMGYLGLSYGQFACTAGTGGSAWNETNEIVIGGSVPGGDGFPNTGSGGGSAGPGNNKSGSGADGVLIIAWDPFIYPCLPDSFKLPGDINSTACTQCQLGSFTLTENASACSKCDTNMYRNRTAGQCLKCRDTATCDPQTPSKRCSNDGSTVCCGRDTYFIDGYSTQCMPCDEGSYSTNGSGSECILCPPGFNCSSGPPHTCLSNFWADNGKCTPCTPACNPGYLVKNECSKENNIECTICAPGSFCPTNFTTIVCPRHTYCPAGSTALIPCPESMRSEIGSYDLKNCSFSKKGWHLSPVTIMINNTKQSPSFKFKNSVTNFRQFFEFKETNKTINTFTFHGSISNIEILAVGGGGAGGNAIAASPTYQNLEWAGGGGGAGMLFYTTGFTPIIARTYNVKVGFGGRGVETIQRQTYPGTVGFNGGDTELSYGNTLLIKATGGGGGGADHGGQGGSGGGSFTYDGEGHKDPDSVCVYTRTLEKDNQMYEALPEIKHACNGQTGYVAHYSGGGGGAFCSSMELSGWCYEKGGSGMISKIKGPLTPYAAGGGGYSIEYTCKYKSGGHVWNGTDFLIIGGSTPGGDGYPNSGSGGASAGSGTKSGSGADGVFIIAWDPVLSLCPLDQYNDMDDSTTCTRCPLGSFTYTEGSTTCSKCEPNTFPNMSSRQCQACRDTATCSSQSPSKKCRNDGSTVCCGVDTYFIDGISTQCMPCDERSYSTDGSGMECTPCVENSKKSDPAQGYFCECDLTQGLYMHNSTSNTCSFCPEDNLCPAQGKASPCPIGMHRYESDTRTDVCQPCENTPQVGEYTWLNSSRCTFQCNAGYYVDNPLEGLFLCNKCTRENFTCAAGQIEPNCNKTKQVCPLGQYTPSCELGRTSDNIGCKNCPATLGAIWTVLCDFTCSTGKFRNTTSMKCNTCSKPTCTPGQYATVCSKDNDSICNECTNGPANGPYSWTSLTCNFLCAENTYYDLLNNSTCQECSEGTYRSSPTSCTKCTTTQCTVPGMHRKMCGRGMVADSICEPICNGTLYFNTSTSTCEVCPENTYRSSLTLCKRCKADKCSPGNFRTQCLIGATTDTYCTSCTNGAVVGSYDWVSECYFVCKYGLYHNRSLNECLNCTMMPTCKEPGKYASPCTDEGFSECINCTTPVTGPFEWTNQCSFTCTNNTFLNNNGTNCTPCTQCPNGTFTSSQCTATENSKCTRCSTVPLTNGTYEWSGVCSFICLDKFVWDGQNCINDTNVTKVSVKMTTKLELNNTVEEICSNLDNIVLAVTNTMEEIFGIPFSGAVNEVNNKTTESVCIYSNNNSTNNSNAIKNNSVNNNKRRLLLSPMTTVSSTATVNSISNEKTTANNVETQTNDNIPAVYTMIKEKLVATDKLNLIASNTFLIEEIKQKTDEIIDSLKDDKIDDPTNIWIVIGAVIGGLVTLIVAVVIIIICCCCCRGKQKQNYSLMQPKSY